MVEGRGPTGLRIDPTAQTVREIHAGARPTRPPEGQLFRIIIPAHRPSCPRPPHPDAWGLPGPALGPTGAPLQGARRTARPAPSAPPRPADKGAPRGAGTKPRTNPAAKPRTKLGPKPGTNPAAKPGTK